MALTRLDLDISSRVLISLTNSAHMALDEISEEIGSNLLANSLLYTSLYASIQGFP